MEQQEQIAEIARLLGRPAQSLHELQQQSAHTLHELHEGFLAARQREELLLEAAYQQAFPRWLYRLIMPWLRRGTS